jgi:hypothetical protein
VPPSLQQLWWREAPVDGRTTMSSEAVCQAVRSWVVVGNFKKMCICYFYDFYGVIQEYFGYTLAFSDKLPNLILMKWDPSVADISPVKK